MIVVILAICVILIICCSLVYYKRDAIRNIFLNKVPCLDIGINSTENIAIITTTDANYDIISIITVNPKTSIIYRSTYDHDTDTTTSTTSDHDKIILESSSSGNSITVPSKEHNVNIPITDETINITLNFDDNECIIKLINQAKTTVIIANPSKDVYTTYSCMQVDIYNVLKNASDKCQSDIVRLTNELDTITSQKTKYKDILNTIIPKITTTRDEIMSKKENINKIITGIADNYNIIDASNKKIADEADNTSITDDRLVYISNNLKATADIKTLILSSITSNIRDKVDTYNMILGSDKSTLMTYLDNLQSKLSAALSMSYGSYVNIINDIKSVSKLKIQTGVMNSQQSLLENTLISVTYRINATNIANSSTNVDTSTTKMYMITNAIIINTHMDNLSRIRDTLIEYHQTSNAPADASTSSKIFDYYAMLTKDYISMLNMNTDSYKYINSASVMITNTTDLINEYKSKSHPHINDLNSLLKSRENINTDVLKYQHIYDEILLKLTTDMNKTDDVMRDELVTFIKPDNSAIKTLLMVDLIDAQNNLYDSLINLNNINDNIASLRDNITINDAIISLLCAFSSTPSDVISMLYANTMETVMSMVNELLHSSIDTDLFNRINSMLADDILICQSKLDSIIVPLNTTQSDIFDLYKTEQAALPHSDTTNITNYISATEYNILKAILSEVSTALNDFDFGIYKKYNDTVVTFQNEIFIFNNLINTHDAISENIFNIENYLDDKLNIMDIIAINNNEINYQIMIRDGVQNPYDEYNELVQSTPIDNTNISDNINTSVQTFTNEIKDIHGLIASYNNLVRSKDDAQKSLDNLLKSSVDEKMIQDLKNKLSVYTDRLSVYKQC